MDNISRGRSACKDAEPWDFPRVLRRVEALRVMTTARGCTPSEADVAARKIGEAVQKYHLLVHPPVSEAQTTSQTFVIAKVLAIGETEKALLCVVNKEEIWVPRSQIATASKVQKEGDYGTLIVTAWYARKAGLSTGRERRS
jgi:hypothetical protein